MLKRNLIAIAIMVSGLVFTSEAFGQLSGTTTGNKPRTVSNGQQSTVVSNKTKKNGTLGDTGTHEVGHKQKQNQSKPKTTSNKSTKNQPNVPSGQIIDAQTGEILWVINNRTSKNRGRNQTAVDEELAALILW